MNIKKMAFSLGFIALGIVVVSLLWRSAVLLALVLVGMAYLRHGEGIIMLSGAWSYAQTQIFNIPVWLPFLWGLTGPTAVTLYEGLVKE